MFRNFSVFINALSSGPHGRADRKSTNDDGSVFYGYDDEETGTTTWYTEDGTCDCKTDTPGDDD